MKLSDVLKEKINEKGELQLDAIQTKLMIEWLGADERELEAFNQLKKDIETEMQQTSPVKK